MGIGDCKHGAEARIISPWYVSRKPSCLSFYYSMRGHPTLMGPLYVSAYDKFDETNVSIRRFL